MAHAAIVEKGGKQYIRVPVAKASSKDDPHFVEVCVDQDVLPADVFSEALYLGLKVLANRGMSDIPGNKSETNRKLARTKAEENVQKLYDGQVRMTGGKIKTAGAVMTEALKDARVRIREELKRMGKKVSLIAASKITALAKQYLATPQGAELVEAAKAAIAAREAAIGEKPIGIDLSGVDHDPKLVKAAEAKKKAKKDANEVSEEDVIAAVSARSRKGGEARTH